MTAQESIGRANAAGLLAALVLLVSAVVDIVLWVFGFLIEGANLEPIIYFWYLAGGLSLVVFGWWFFESYRLIRLVGSKQTNYSPGLAATLLVIPFINLAFAYSLLRELWRRTSNGNATPESSIPAPAVLKWAYGLAIFYLISSASSARHEPFTSQYEAAGYFLLPFGLSCAAKLAGRALVRRISRLQTQLVVGVQNQAAEDKEAPRFSVHPRLLPQLHAATFAQLATLWVGALLLAAAFVVYWARTETANTAAAARFANQLEQYRQALATNAARLRVYRDSAADLSLLGSQLRRAGAIRSEVLAVYDDMVRSYQDISRSAQIQVDLYSRLVNIQEAEGAAALQASQRSRETRGAIALVLAFLVVGGVLVLTWRWFGGHRQTSGGVAA